MSQNFSYPSSSSVTVAAVGPNGQPIPTSSILIAGNDPSNNLVPVLVTSNGEVAVTITDQVGDIAVNLDQVGGDNISLGIATAVDCIPVVLASDTVLPLPTGAATSALQTTGNTSLSSINSKLGSLGQKTMAGSAPVVIASDQASIPVTVSGVATAANQTTELTRLSGSLVPTAFDEIDLTYVPSGNGVGQVATAVYKLATVTVKTLTMSYDGSDRLISTVAS